MFVVQLPPPVYAALPERAEVSATSVYNAKVVEVRSFTKYDPFALVLPTTPLIVMACPSKIPNAETVVITIGVALDAAVTDPSNGLPRLLTPFRPVASMIVDPEESFSR